MEKKNHLPSTSMTLSTMLIFQGVCSLHPQKLFLAGDVPTNGCFGKPEDKSKIKRLHFCLGYPIIKFWGLMVNLMVLEVDHHGEKDVDLQRW